MQGYWVLWRRFWEYLASDNYWALGILFLLFGWETLSTVFTVVPTLSHVTWGQTGNTFDDIFTLSLACVQQHMHKTIAQKYLGSSDYYYLLRRASACNRSLLLPFWPYIIHHKICLSPITLFIVRVQCSAVQCTAVQFSTVQCSAVQCSAVVAKVQKESAQIQSTSIVHC